MDYQVIIPDEREIATMSRSRLQLECLQIRNEISFARGSALWGGPPVEETLTRLKNALRMLEERISQLAASSSIDCAAS
jgi:hypothetical protein